MLGHFAAIGVHPSTVSTDPMGKPGEIREWLDDTYGVQLYRHVSNNSVADIAAGLVLDFDAGSQEACGLAAADAPRVNVAGVTQYVLPTTYYGWALCYGDGLVEADAAVVQDAPMITAGGVGKVDDTAVAGLEHCILGRFKTATVGAAATRGFFNCAF